ncbi:MAG: ATP-binding protein [Planctomycetota bacterium]
MTAELGRNRRILVIDDNRTIHDDVRKILRTEQATAADLNLAEAALFGDAAVSARADSFEIDSAYQGQEGLEMVRQALQAERPYAVAFVDVRMPPGWDGITTIGRLWQEDPNLEVVICTAYSDYTWEEMAKTLGETDHLLVLKKPFDNIEVRQLACALREKWNLACQVRHTVDDLEEAVAERTRELQERQEQLHKAHAEIRQLFEAISSVLIGVDVDGRVTAWNGTAERTFGIDSENAAGQLLDDLRMEWDYAVITRSMAECHAEKRPVRIDEMRFKRPDGTEGFLGVTLNPVSADAGRGLGFLLVAADITEQKILQSQLSQAQKLESIGQLAAGIAHEINTPTQFVGDNTRFLQDAFADLQGLLAKYARLAEAGRTGSVTPEILADMDAAEKEADLEYLAEEIPKAITQSLEGIERVSRIVRAMKDFSHPGVEGKEAVDLNKAIESTITVARNEWKYVAEMVTDFDPALPPVPCLAGEFNQVILNIVINAAHAIAGVVGENTGEKGTITIATRQDGGWAEIRISDTGTGIPAEHRSKVFDHFFTTKEVGKGTGQGLAIAHAVVAEKHGGTITLETEMGQGTTFIIRLPIEHKPATPKEMPQYEETHSLR